ncbi:MAG: hypothetical protein FJ264_15245 [Planctomycetes bacterium]|nr:hypothetical protein [Planctomycetota bacterium]
MLEIRVCAYCKRSLSKIDIESGNAFYQEGGKVVCGNCLAGQTKNEEPCDENEYALESILREVKNINRTLTYEPATWLTILASVIQCFVFGSLVFAYLHRNGDVHSYLLLALIFQVMALTFFVVKK